MRRHNKIYTFIYSIKCLKSIYKGDFMKILINDKLDELGIGKAKADNYNAQAVFIYLLLNCFSNDVTYKGYKFGAGDILCSLAEIAQVLHISKTTISKALKKLEQCCYISRERLFIGGKEYIYIKILDSELCKIESKTGVNGAI